MSDEIDHYAVGSCSTWLGTLFVIVFLIGLGAQVMPLAVCGIALSILWLAWVYREGIREGMRRARKRDV